MRLCWAVGFHTCQPYPLDITNGDVFLDPDGNPGCSGGVTCLVCHVAPGTMRSHTDFMVVGYLK